MANIRIKDQTTDTALAAGDYVIVDNATEGTRKFDLGQKLEDIDDDFTDVRQDLEELQNDAGVTAELKSALLDIAENIAYINENGQTLYDNLYNALYPNASSITCVYTQTGTVYTTDTLDSLKDDLVVTAHYSDSTTKVLKPSDYTLTGTLTTGTSTITVHYGNLVATFTVTVTARTLTGISAVYTPSGTVYTNDTLNSLKTDLVVTATYSDTSTEVVSDYTLSGTLAEGTDTITVSYGGKTTTFTVTCVVKGWMYHFEQTLDSSGSKDFEWKGAENYTTGHDGTGYAYWHKVTTEGTSSTDTGAIYANGLTDIPDLSGDFTISMWAKCFTEKRGQVFSPFTVAENAGTLGTTGYSDPSNIKSGYTVVSNSLNNGVRGIRLWFYSGTTFQIRLISSDLSNGKVYNITGFPSGYTNTDWHHYALTRKNGTIRFFIDGEIIFTIVSLTAELLFNNQVSLGGYFEPAGATTPKDSSYGNCFDDLYITDWCKWDSNFDTSAITY